MNRKRLRQLFHEKKGVIGVLMGGFSSEREISLKSGKAVSQALRSLGYIVKDIDVTAPDIPELVSPDFDIGFIALHGKFGEDGGIQSLLDTRGIFYTGSGVKASQRAMDKFATKKAFISHNIPTTPYQLTTNNEQLTIKLDYPIVVKPRAEGSSVGVSIIREPHQLADGLKEAFKYGKDVLVEKYIAGREVTVGILDDEPLPVIELKPRQLFYSYQAKYQDPGTEYIINPDLTEKVLRKIQSIGLAAHQALGCSGISRVDMIYSSEQGPVVLEVNTIPGLTERSLLPKAAKAVGIEFPQLCEKIIELAIC